MKWRRISGATNLLSQILKISKIPQNFQNIRQFFSLSKFTPSKSKFSTKMDNMLEGNGWWICVQNFKSISSKMAEIWHKTCQKQALFTSFRDFTVIFRILFFYRFWCFKKCFRIIFAFFAKIWPKNMYRSSKSRTIFAWTFLPGDLTWPWPLL